MSKACILFFIMLQCSVINAQTDCLKKNSKEYIYSMYYSDTTGLTGPGWYFLQSKLKDSQYVLLGETHGTKEIPVIVKEINDNWKFDYFITEIDSMSAAFLTGPAIEKNQVLYDVPGGFAMYSTKEESELIESLLVNEVAIEGIDMVHPISFRLFLFALLQTKGLSQKSYRRVRSLIAQQEKDIVQIGVISSKEKRKMERRLIKINKKDFKGKNGLIFFLLNNKYPPRQMENRAIYMQEKFLALAKQKGFSDMNILFKFGSSHLKKIKNTAGFIDLGACVNDYSKKNKINTCFVGVFAVNGLLGLPMMINGGSVKITALENDSYCSAEYSLFKEINNTDQYIVVDIKGFKEKSVSKGKVCPFLKELMDNYDVLIFVKEVTAAQHFN